MFEGPVIVAIIVFVGFMSLVGVPSEGETKAGLSIAAIAFVISMIAQRKSK